MQDNIDYFSSQSFAHMAYVQLAKTYTIDFDFKLYRNYKYNEKKELELN